MKTFSLLVVLATTFVSASAQDEYVVTYFDKTEIKESEGQLKNGQSDGRWKYYNRKGVITKEIDYHSGVVSGRMAYYYDNGNLQSEGYVYQNKAQGEYHEYNRDGSLKVSGRYLNSNKDSIWNYYNINGTLIFVEKCSPSGCLAVSAYTNAGKPLFENGTGTYITYFPDEQTIKEQGDYRDGLREGLWKTYFINGKIAIQKT